jgi:hypothetical protein
MLLYTFASLRAIFVEMQLLAARDESVVVDLLSSNGLLFRTCFGRQDGTRG